MKLAIEPIQGNANVLGLTFAVSMFSFAQAKPSKIEAQDRKSEAIQRLHGMEDDFVVHRPAINRMRVANQGRMGCVLSTGVEQRFESARRAFDEQ
jgi:hypothetical protein